MKFIIHSHNSKCIADILSCETTGILEAIP